MNLCPHCGRPLEAEGGLELCLICNEFISPEDEKDSAKVVLECPGVTLYDVETGQITQGVKWHDPQDVGKGFEIVGQPVYAPNHATRRVIDADQLGKITRCRACQDYTVRKRAQQRDHSVKQGPSAARRRAENLFKK